MLPTAMGTPSILKTHDFQALFSPTPIQNERRVWKTAILLHGYLSWNILETFADAAQQISFPSIASFNAQNCHVSGRSYDPSVPFTDVKCAGARSSVAVSKATVSICQNHNLREVALTLEEPVTSFKTQRLLSCCF